MTIASNTNTLYSQFINAPSLGLNNKSVEQTSLNKFARDLKAVISWHAKSTGYHFNNNLGDKNVKGLMNTIIENYSKQLGGVEKEIQKCCKNLEIRNTAILVNNRLLEQLKNIQNLNSKDDIKIRLKNDLNGRPIIKEQYTGLKHIRKAIFSKSYGESLKNADNKFNSKYLATACENIKKENSRYQTEIPQIKSHVNNLHIEQKSIMENLNEAKATKNGVLRYWDLTQQKKAEKEDIIRSKLPKVNLQFRFKPEERRAFMDLYSTLEGYTKINKSLRSGTKLDINLSSVKTQLEKRHAADYSTHSFDKGHLKNLHYTLSAEGGMSVLKDSLHDMFLEAAVENENKAPKTTYRGQEITITGLQKLKQLAQHRGVISPDGLLSSSTSKKIANEFVASAYLGDKDKRLPSLPKTDIEATSFPLMIEVEGKTGVPVYSQFVVEKELEYAYLPNSKFEIVDLYKEPTLYKLVLREILPTTDEYKTIKSNLLPY